MQNIAEARPIVKLTGGNMAGIVEELQRLVGKPAPRPEVTTKGKDAIMAVLARAADDMRFLARLAQNPAEALAEYDLTTAERAALAAGDLAQIEAWVGKLDQRLATWIWCRLQQEKW